VSAGPGFTGGEWVSLNKAVNPALILVFGELVPAIAERIRQTPL
jgi:hypothetical protein